MAMVVALYCTVLCCTVLYCRMAIVVALSTVEGKLSNTLLRFEGLIVSMTASALTLTAILILNFLYTRVAVWLTDKELHRWQCQHYLHKVEWCIRSIGNRFHNQGPY